MHRPPVSGYLSEICALKTSVLQLCFLDHLHNTATGCHTAGAVESPWLLLAFGATCLDCFVRVTQLQPVAAFPSGLKLSRSCHDHRKRVVGLLSSHTMCYHVWDDVMHHHVGSQMHMHTASAHNCRSATPWYLPCS